MTLAQPATNDALQFRVIGGMEHDSNVLRVPSSLGTTSDDVATLGVGVKFDKKAGLQRFRADAEYDTYRYHRLSGLDYHTLNYSAAWDWMFTPAFHGVLSADRQQFREVTTDSLTGTNRIGRRTQRAEVLEGMYEIDGAWRALAGIGHTRAESTDPNSWDASPDIDTAHVGVGYQFASGTMFAAKVKHGDGEYTALTVPGPKDFHDRETELTLKWPVTGKTNIEARVAHIDRTHPGAPLRDFSGIVGSATAAWEITGKTRLIAALSKDLSGGGQSLGGHVESKRVYLSPVWRATAKTSFNAKYEHVVRDWRNTPAGSPDIGRHEVIDIYGIGTEWEALRTVFLTANLRSERLKSSIVTTGYRATVFSVAIKGYF